MNNYQKFFFVFFICTCIICFSPLKALPYIFPLFFVFVSQFFFNRILRVLFLGLFIASLFVLYRVIYGNVLVAQNFIISVFTYSSFIPIFFVDYKRLYSEELEEKIVRFITGLMIVQSIIGIIQALYGFSVNRSFDVANGDYVEGTIAPGLMAEQSFSNVMFVSNMVFLLNFLLPIFLKGKLTSKWPFYLSVFVVLLASVVHSVLIYSVSLVIAFLIIKPRIFRISKSGIKKLIVVGSLIGIVTSILLRENFRQIPNAVVNIASPEFPRAIITLRVLTEIPGVAPMQPWIGLGPGQFCSRASLLSSGIYLGGLENPRGLPLIGTARNMIADSYLFSLVEEWANVTYLGSSNQPYYSFLSIYSEMGIIGLIAFLLCMVRLMFIVMKVSHERNTLKIECFTFFAGATYLLMLGMQENYYEVPQAIFIGVLLLQFTYAKIRYAKV